jgi:predicted RNA-binding Zn ribbon-like protein
VQRFVNTIDLERSREWLETPADLEAWLEEAALPIARRATSSDLRRAHELRAALRALLVANNEGARPPLDAIAAVNAAAAAGRLVPELDASGRVAFEPGGAGVDAALARIVALAFAAMLDRSWERLKACRNCRWAFYDYSRNRAGSWCSMSICGNRLKTRRYRGRKVRAR